MKRPFVSYASDSPDWHSQDFAYESHKCPKCGSEMEPTDAEDYSTPPMRWWVCTNLDCGHEEKVKQE